MKTLTPEEIRASLRLLDPWKRRGCVITREFRLKDFVEAMRFENAVARIAEKVQHHPDIDIRWNTVRLALTTHDAGGLTTMDFEVAQAIEKNYGSNRRPLL